MTPTRARVRPRVRVRVDSMGKDWSCGSLGTGTV